VRRQHPAEGVAVGRQRPPAVRDHHERLAQRLAPEQHSHDPQPVPVRAQRAGDDRHAVAGLGEREQRMRGTALEPDARLEAREPACGVEHLPDHEVGGDLQQGAVGEVGDVDGAARAQPDRRTDRREQLDRAQRMARDTGRSRTSSQSRRRARAR
jgi:hypothetical protein